MKNADAFLLRHIHQYPRMILNEASVLTTDTLLKVRFFQKEDKEKICASFLNSYTVALGELVGRTYGGGVLEFVPSEMRKMRISWENAEKLDLSQIDIWQRKGQTEKILAYTDDILLRQGLGLEEEEIQTLKNISNKLKGRRLMRKGKI